MFWKIPAEGIQRLVRPGYPNIIAKSPSLKPFRLIGKWYFGFKGTLSFEYSAGLPSLSAYTRNNEKSPVWRGHSQLSVSPPNFPMLLGGVPTKRTSLKS